MPEAPYSADEPERLIAVQQSGLLGTPAEERFDRITRLACKIFNMPMAVIDIVGEKVAWIKSGPGLKNIIGLRKDSYCHHTVFHNEICLTSDARNDPRFCDSVFAQQWVFYAGVPIHFKDKPVGVLCIGDNKPRTFTKDNQEILKDLALLVEHELRYCELSEAQIALAQANEELEKKSRIDPLTRCWNREAILQITKMELEKQFPLAALMVDVDFFKQVNDTFGHQAGDEVLSEIAQRIRRALRPFDALGRYGGDEFLVILNQVTKEELVLIGDQICEEVSKIPISFKEGTLQTTCSIGGALSRNKDSVDTLIKRADVALYEAKEKGRGNMKTAF